VKDRIADLDALTVQSIAQTESAGFVVYWVEGKDKSKKKSFMSDAARAKFAKELGKKGLEIVGWKDPA